MKCKFLIIFSGCFIAHCIIKTSKYRLLSGFSLIRIEYIICLLFCRQKTVNKHLLTIHRKKRNTASPDMPCFPVLFFQFCFLKHFFGSLYMNIISIVSVCHSCKLICTLGNRKLSYIRVGFSL